MMATSAVLLGRTASRPISSLSGSSSEDLCKRDKGFRSEASISTAFHSEVCSIPAFDDVSDSDKEEDMALVAASAAREAFLSRRKRIAERHSGFNV